MKLNKISEELARNKVRHTVKGGKILVQSADNSGKIKSMEDKAFSEMEKALKLMQDALLKLNSSKELYRAVAKEAGRWNYPIEDLGYISKSLSEIISSDGGRAGFNALVKLQGRK